MNRLEGPRSDGAAAMRLEARPPAWRTAAPWLAMLGLAVASLWLHQAVPLVAFGDNWWDERLFAELAKDIARGQWLGEYGPQTLSKGPFYPVFIAVVFFLGLPLKVGEQALYLASAGLLCGVAARWTGRWPAVAVFALLAFNPVQWFSLVRVLRENIYGAEALLVLALAARVLLQDDGRPGVRWGWPVALGAALAAYWLTREETVWLLPSLGMMALFWLVERFRARRQGSERRRRHELLAVLLPVAVCLAGIAVVNTLNWRHYGVWRSNDLAASPGFTAAYGALTRITTDKPNPRLLFTREARARAYQVSGAARELEAFFEGAAAARWIASTCAYGQTEDERQCREPLSGWLPWMLRDAVNGLDRYYKDARQAEAYYRRLADEVNAGCDSGQIPCGPPRASLMPPLPPGWEWERRILARMATALDVLASFGRDEHQAWQSAGQPMDLALFQDLTRGRLAPETAPGTGLFVRGWIAEASRLADFTLRPHPGTRPNALHHRSIDWNERFDIDVGLPVLGFHVTNSCSPADCDLVLHLPGREPQALPLSLAVQPGTRLIDQPGLILMIDEIGPAENGDGRWLGKALDKARLSLMRRIAAVYARAMPVAAGLGLLALLAVAAVDLRRRRLCPATVLAAALLAAALVRVALLAVIDVTSFHVLEPHYMAPAHPLLLAFTGLSLALAARRLPWRRQGQTP